jgi:hypothetical protein
MRSDEIVSQEKLLELARAIVRQAEENAEVPEKRYIIGAFLTVAVCVIGPVLWVMVMVR